MERWTILRKAWTVVLGVGVLGLVGVARAADVPLGHRDFYPSPERPVGYRGDGNGDFPGATPVTTWAEGTLAKMQRPNPPHKPEEVLVPVDDKGTNIVWKTEMPGWVNSQPIVVGDRVFTTAEPNQIVCVDAHSGRILWTRTADIFGAAGVEKERAAKLNEMVLLYHVIYDFNEYVTIHGGKGEAPGIAGQIDVVVKKVLPRCVAALRQLDPEVSYDDAAARTSRALAAYGEALPKLSGGKPQVPDTARRDLRALEKAIATSLKKHWPADGGPLPLETPWGNLIGWMMAVPVSDGRHVYVSFGQSVTACYDLDGKVVWQKHVPLSIMRGGTGRSLYTIQSPLLAGDILVDMHGGTEKLRGLNKRTGEVVWEAPVKGDFDRFGKKGGYYVGSHKVVRLVWQNQPVDVIVTNLCNIIRARDGKVLGYLPFAEEGLSGGPSIFGPGDIVIKGCKGDAVNTPLVAYRLAFTAEDKVTATEIWRHERTPGDYYGYVGSPRCIITDGKPNIADPQTGKALFEGRGGKGGGFGHVSTVLAGNTLLWQRAVSSWSDRRVDGKVTITFLSADLSDPSKPKMLSDRNILGGLNMPRCVEYEKYAPELLADDKFWGCWGGRPRHGCYADTVMFPAGNRVFIRTLSHLYCIGDPAVKYDWNPQSRPR